MRGYRRILLCLIFVMTLAGRASKSATAKPQRSAPSSPWVEKTLKSMSLREKLGQLLVVYFFGEFTSTESGEYKDLVRQVSENHVGGFILGTKRQPLGIERGGVYVAAVLANQMQKRAKVPLIVSADFERGTAMRLDEGTGFPYAMAVAAAGNPKDAYTVGKVTALEARAAGIQWIFAPDADVNDNPDNPIINVRSFGEDPQSVAKFVSEFVRGVQENGGLATAKHFPGHGDVSVDSHLTLATVPGDRKRLESVELVPFRAAIAAGVGSIMTGHLATPAFEPDPELPATMSPHVLTDLLRNELGFGGLIVTDALDMGGVTTRYPPGEAAVRSVWPARTCCCCRRRLTRRLRGLKKPQRVDVCLLRESMSPCGEFCARKKSSGSRKIGSSMLTRSTRISASPNSRLPRRILPTAASHCSAITRTLCRLMRQSRCGCWLSRFRAIPTHFPAPISNLKSANTSTR